MSGKRKSESDLPSRVYLKNGTYYYVDLENKWHRLCKARSYVEVSLEKLYAAGSPSEKIDFDKWVSRVWHSIKTNARRRNLPVEITKIDIKARLQLADYKCEVTGLAFNPRRRTSWKNGPWMPSVDRIDCRQGYTKENVRIVAVCVNMALNEFGIEVLEEMLTSPKLRARFDLHLRNGANLLETAP